MSEIEEFQRRIKVALDQIAAGLEKTPDIAAHRALMEDLEVERAKSTQLQDKFNDQTAKFSQLENRQNQLIGHVETLAGENKRLEAVIDALRETNKSLREANAKHMGAGEVINEALSAEIEDLKSSRVADLAELDDILADLAPMLKEA